MRLAIVTQKFPDPSQTPTHNHIERLFGGDTVVICREIGDSVSTERVFLHSPHQRWSQMSLCDLIEAGHNVSHRRSMRVPVGGRKLRIESFLKANKVDAILAEFGTEGVWFWPVAKALNVPFYVYFRGYDATGFLTPMRRRKQRVQAYQDMINAADGVFSVSPFLFRRLEQHGVLIAKGYVIPSGVDTSLFKPGVKDGNLIMAAGRFIEKKAPDLTIKAFAAISRSFPNAKLEMVGDGPELEKCRMLSMELGVSEKVIFHGNRSHRFVMELMARATIFMQHSIVAGNGDQEGAPTSIQEAMSSGACVISTQHAGIPDLIEDGITGLLVKENDLDAYTYALNRAMLHPSFCKRAGNIAREHAVRVLDKSLSNKHIERVIRGEPIPSERHYSSYPNVTSS